ncbi:MAG: hypothetical protein M3362_15560 [Acidobacteriota bacterium]|nr:hypothetical protein [Acidobacteriota bacterium]
MAEKVSEDQLEKVLGLDEGEVVAGGEKFIIRPFRLRQIIQAAKFVSELADQGLVQTEEGRRDFNFTKMLLQGGDSVLKILEIATGKDIYWLGELDPVDGIKLCGKVWEVNADFFDRNKVVLMEAVGPLLIKAQEWLADLLLKRVAALGRKQSKDSSAADTGSKRSESTPSTK